MILALQGSFAAPIEPARYLLLAPVNEPCTARIICWPYPAKQIFIAGPSKWSLYCKDHLLDYHPIWKKLVPWEKILMGNHLLLPQTLFKCSLLLYSASVVHDRIGLHSEGHSFIPVLREGSWSWYYEMGPGPGPKRGGILALVLREEGSRPHVRICVFSKTSNWIFYAIFLR